MRYSKLLVVAMAAMMALPAVAQKKEKKEISGNPLFPGWYADPHAIIYGKTYWVFPTYSDRYEKQTHMDAFSSTDLVNWTKHPNIIDNTEVTWINKAMWAPAALEKDGKYYLFFAGNDVHEGEIGGIGVAVADKPEGPYKDLIGKPLINEIVNGAQPIDQFVWEENGEYLMYYGGWGHCNLVKLSDDFTHLVPFEDGTIYKEITPAKEYVEGSFMIKRNGVYYFMWSEGGWTGPNYFVAYAMADNPYGPFKRIGRILEPDLSVARGSGHHSIVNVPGTDDWYIFYHRRPLSETNGNHRATCVEKLEFNEDGTIKPVKITFDGVKPHKIKKAPKGNPYVKN